MVVRGSAWLAASWTSRRGDAGVESGGDEGVAQRVGADVLVQPRLAGDAAHDPGCRVTVHPPPGRGEEHRSTRAVANGQIERSGNPWGQRHGDDLAALAHHRDDGVSPFDVQVVDVDAQRFGDAQPVQCEQ